MSEDAHEFQAKVYDFLEIVEEKEKKYADGTLVYPDYVHEQGKVRAVRMRPSAPVDRDSTLRR